MEGGGAGELVRAAAGGDQQAWDALVARFGGLVWSVARAHRLGAADAADAVQTTWLRLVEHHAQIRDPDRIGAWLATTARRECLRTLRRQGRQVPTDDVVVPADDEASTPAPDVRLLRAERDAVLWRALDALPDRCKAVLRVLLADPPPRYDEAAAALGVPVGYLGPTRARCLEKLRRTLETTGIAVDPGASSY